MIVRPSAAQLMAGPLGGWLEQQKAVREEAKKQSANRLFKAGMIGLPLLAFLWILAPIGAQLKIFATLAAGTFAFTWSQGPKNKAKKQVKTGINEAIAQSLGLQFSCEVEPGTPFAACRQYEMVPGFDRSTFEDEWSGTLEGRPFRLFEAHLEERQGGGKNRHWVTVFRGAILSLGCARDVHGTTLVQRSGQHTKWFGGKRDSVTFDGHQLDCVDLVNPQFEDAFDVWSDDQVEARYLVNPAYVEKLIALEDGFQGQNIQALFHEGELVIALKTENMFESGSIDAGEDSTLLAQTIEQFGRLADLAETLNEAKRGASAAPQVSSTGP